MNTKFAKAWRLHPCGWRVEVDLDLDMVLQFRRVSAARTGEMDYGIRIEVKWGEIGN